MHTLYKRKKTLFLVALCCMNSLGSFMPTVRGSSSEGRYYSYAPPPLSTLPKRIEMIAKSKAKEYTKIQKYYEYSVSLSKLFTLNPVLLAFCFIFMIYPLYEIIEKLKKNPSFEALKNLPKKVLIPFFFFGTFFVYFLYLLISSFLKKSDQGAIFLTDTGILFIDCGHNAKHTFIPYADIKTVKPSPLADGLINENTMMAFEIQFVKDFSEYERKGIKCSDGVNSVVIEEKYMPNKAQGGNAFKNLYGSLLYRIEGVHMEVMREKAKQESTQEKEKSLLEIKKEKENLIDRLDTVSDKLSSKIATVEANHPKIFEEIEAYYINSVSTRLLEYVLLELAVIAGFIFIFWDQKYNAKPLFDKGRFHILLDPLIVGFFFFGNSLYNQYDLFMYPAGLFITDTGFLYIEQGKKLKYRFIRYEHIEELLSNVNEQTLIVRSAQSTHEASSWINGNRSQTLKIECHDMDKEIFDALYEHLQLKITITKAGRSRLAA